jgi:DNA-binding IclR family transcriptional regulator
METAQKFDQALAVVGALREQGSQSAEALAALTGLSRDATRRLVSTLQRRGFISETRPGAYQLGPAWLGLAERLPDYLAEASSPVIDELARATSEVVVVGRAREGRFVVVAERDGTSTAFRVSVPVGIGYPLGGAAGGIVLLPYLPDDVVEAAVAESGEPEFVRSLFDGIRSDRVLHLRSRMLPALVGLASPILVSGRIVGSVTIATAADAGDRLAGHVDLVRAGAERIAVEYERLRGGAVDVA